jgi:hypothetical protein
MARSYRHAPFSGITTSPSEKQDKRAANRRLRRLVRARLPFDEGILDLGIRDVSNVWSFAKDGKSRFDPRRYPEEMRK